MRRRNFPIFCVEGPDAVGKTTLCREFKNRVGARYIHLTLRKHMHLYQVGALEKALVLSEHVPVLIDRHWPSEHVYASIYRGGSNLEAEGATMRYLFRQFGVQYIYCHLSSVDEMVDAHESMSHTGREMYEPDQRIRDVAEQYEDLYYGNPGCRWHSLTGRIAKMGGMKKIEGAIAYNYRDGLLRDPRHFISYAMAAGHLKLQQCPAGPVMMGLREYLKTECKL